MHQRMDFNAVNNIIQIIDSAGTQSFTYDSVDRLTSATHTGQANESYTYDAVGNRTASHLSSSYTYQPFNRLTSTSAATFSYDNNGNLTSKTEGLQTTQFVWDFENRLLRVSSLGSQDVWYKYDALGRRIERDKGVASPIPLATETTRFVYDGADVVRDLDGAGSAVADYLNAPSIDNKLRQTVSGTASYFIQDHLGTTRGFADASGNGTSSLSYDAFGNIASGSAPTRYTYTGRESDSDTGLMYYRARFYYPQTGRFISEDPIGLAGGKNHYTYVDNIPTRFVDPLGLWPSIYPFDTHQRSTARVLGNRLGPQQIEILQTVQYEWDDYSQDENYAFAHAMRMRNESAACARLKANAWVKANIGIARRLDKLGYRNQALWYLGVAIHALQDSTSRTRQFPACLAEYLLEQFQPSSALPWGVSL
jgi:RHS repeat-associated protein